MDAVVHGDPEHDGPDHHGDRVQGNAQVAVHAQDEGALAGFEDPGPASSVRLLLPPAGRGEIEMPTWTGNQFELASGAYAQTIALNAAGRLWHNGELNEVGVRDPAHWWLGVRDEDDEDDFDEDEDEDDFDDDY